MESRSAAEYLGGEYLGPLSPEEKMHADEKRGPTRSISPLFPSPAGKQCRLSAPDIMRE